MVSFNDFSNEQSVDYLIFKFNSKLLTSKTNIEIQIKELFQTTILNNLQEYIKTYTKDELQQYLDNVPEDDYSQIKISIKDTDSTLQFNNTYESEDDTYETENVDLTINNNNNNNNKVSIKIVKQTDDSFVELLPKNQNSITLDDFCESLDNLEIDTNNSLDINKQYFHKIIESDLKDEL